VSEIVVHRTDGDELPVRARSGLVEPIDACVTRLLGLALVAEALPVSELVSHHNWLMDGSFG